MGAMDGREAVAWLARRAAFGFMADERERREQQGAGAWLAELLDPDAAGVAPSPDPFVDVEEVADPNDNRQRAAMTRLFVERWIDQMVTTPRPLEEMMTWFWAGHFAVQQEEVRSGRLMADHVSLLRRHALGNVRDLVRAVTTDPAMLLFLDGATSTAKAPNENYARELLELYTLGIGHFDEPDVQAAAAALTGWTVRRADPRRAVFVANRHDARPRTLFGRAVADVDSVVDAAVSHPACAPLIAREVATFFLGSAAAERSVSRYATVLRSAGMELRPLVRAVLEDGIANGGDRVVRSPVAWWVAVRKALGVAPAAAAVQRALRSGGQVPASPPNVGGWPPPTAWLGASATAARVELAVLAADAVAARSPVLGQAAAGDALALGRLLAVPGGLSDSTATAMRGLGACGARPGTGALAVALASPDVAVG